MEMLGGEVDFSVDGLMRCFQGLGGGGGRSAEGANRFKQLFPSDTDF